jgi:GDPmannose 4,6-dehydratase
MPRALITGVNGQDGSYLAELLLAKGYQVSGWVPASIPISLENIQHLLDQVNLVEGDLSDQYALYGLLEEIRPDEIFHLASPSSPDSSWEAVVEVGDAAGLGVARLLEAVRRVTPRARFYQASSSELFGEPVEIPQRETTPFQPRNPYGIAKLYAHWLVVNYRERYGLFCVSGILYNHESPRRGSNFVTRKISQAAARIKLGLANELRLGNLEARRDWGFAGDYVEAMWRMLQQARPDNYVIGTGETHSVREFCELAFACLDLDYRQYVVQDPRFFRPVEARQLVSDPSKARQQLGWQACTSFPDLVQMMVQADLQALQPAA